MLSQPRSPGCFLQYIQYLLDKRGEVAGVIRASGGMNDTLSLYDGRIVLDHGYSHRHSS